MSIRSIACAAALAATSSSAAVIWRGDFETGDLGQWSRIEAVAADRLRVVQDPREGSFALRAEVRQGDDPIGASGNRNELVHHSPTPEGQERWFRWSTRFDTTFPPDDAWQVFTQWHHEGPGGSPPMLFNARANQLMFMVTAPGGEPRPLWTTPLVRGVWHDFVLHVKWSSNAADGFVELWYDSAQVLPITHVATLYPGQANYLKQGLYRSAVVVERGVVFHDGFIEGTAPEDVFSPPAAQTNPATPPPAEVPPATDEAPLSPGSTSEGGGGGCATGGPASLALLAPALIAAAVRARRKTGRRREQP